MVRYMTMKRITQILASVLFVITVVTVYLAFDFAINNAVLHRNSLQKRIPHENYHDHDQPHDNIKISKKRSIAPVLLNIKKSNRTIKNTNEHKDNHDLDHDRRLRNAKKDQVPLRPKPGNFHKGKTGVKVNKPPKLVNEQRKRSSTTTKLPQHKDKHHLDDKKHV